MSHMARDRAQVESNTDMLQTSNQTSEHFLGTVPRHWMQSGRDASNIGAATSVNAVNNTRSRLVTQNETQVFHTGQLLRRLAPTAPPLHDLTTIETTQGFVATEQRPGLVGNHVSESNLGAARSNNIVGSSVGGIPMVNNVTVASPPPFSPAIAKPLANSADSASLTNRVAPTQQYRSNGSHFSEPFTTGGPVHIELRSRPDLLRELNNRFQPLLAQIRPSDIDLDRMHRLRDACLLGDEMYTMLHQIVCIHFVQPHCLSSALFFDHVQLSGVRLLDQVFGNSKEISPPIMSMLANFVIPLEMVATDVSIQSWLPRMRKLLTGFTAHWPALQERVFQRQYPPSALELFSVLDVGFPVLSQAFYTQLLIQLCPGLIGELLHDAIFLFQCSYKVLRSSLQERFTDAVWNARQEQEAKSFAIKFNQIFDKYRRSRSNIAQSVQNQAVEHTTLNCSQADALQSRSNSQHIQLSSAVSQSLSTQNIAHASPAVPIRPIPYQHSNAQQNMQPLASASVFPGPEQLLPITANPNHHRSALHQAHLASPMLTSTSETTPHGHKFRIYSFLDDIIGEAKKIDHDTHFGTWKILVAPEILVRRVKVISAAEDDPFSQPMNVFRNGALIFHLRCVEINSTNEPLNQSTYSSSPTFWPEHLFISINGTHLEFRRRFHHGRDLPVDVTSILKAENRAELSYYANKKEQGRKFLIALEAVVTFEHEQSLRLARPTDFPTSLSAIMKSHQDRIYDEEVVMNDEHISIDLIDPFTARIFDKPVRGQDCRHRECFDLEAFLRSRSCRNKDDLVHPDEWKCPICGKDARPSSLIIDGFLVSVKENLVATGKGDTRAILVKSDGSWEAKSVNSGASSDPIPRPPQEPSAAVPGLAIDAANNIKRSVDSTTQRQSSSVTSNEPVIIDLMDDGDD